MFSASSTRRATRVGGDRVVELTAGISRPSIANQVSTELMARSQVFKALEALEKNQLVKTFKSVNVGTCDWDHN